MLPSYQHGLSSPLCRQHHIHRVLYIPFTSMVFGKGSAWHLSCMRSHRHVKLYAMAVQVCVQAHGIEIILYHICQHCVWQGSACLKTCSFMRKKPYSMYAAPHVGICFQCHYPVKESTMQTVLAFWLGSAWLTFSHWNTLHRKKHFPNALCLRAWTGFSVIHSCVAVYHSIQVFSCVTWNNVHFSGLSAYLLCHITVYETEKLAIYLSLIVDAFLV